MDDCNNMSDLVWSLLLEEGLQQYMDSGGGGGGGGGGGYQEPKNSPST